MRKWIASIFVGVLCVTMTRGMMVVDASKTAADKKNVTVATLKGSEEVVTLNVRGATIWPVQDVTVKDAKGKEIEKIAAGTPLVALAEADGIFKIVYNNQAGYIPSDCCMINLPDVLQEEMEYDITNAYSSIYKIHGKSIENVTGEVLYPYVMTGDDEYLVPLLFPVAKKLYAAEEDALSRNLTLKIYDAYRPYEVSKYIYATMISFLNTHSDYMEMMTEEVKGKTYGPGAFLNSGVSFHNYGVAVDITLVDLSTGKELSAQAPMHELSTRSIHLVDNKNALLLKEIMTAHKFTTISSEWWHFEIRDYVKEYAAFQAKPIE